MQNLWNHTGKVKNKNMCVLCMELWLVVVLFGTLFLFGIGLLAMSFSVTVQPQQMLLVATGKEQTPSVYRNGRKFLLPFYHRYSVLSINQIDFTFRSRAKADTGDDVDFHISVGVHAPEDQILSRDVLMKLFDLQQRNVEDFIRRSLMSAIQQTIQSPRYIPEYQHIEGLLMESINNHSSRELQQVGLSVYKMQVHNLSPIIEKVSQSRETAASKRHMTGPINIVLAGRGTLAKSGTQVHYNSTFQVQGNSKIIKSVRDWDAPAYSHLKTMNHNAYLELMRGLIQKGIDEALVWIPPEALNEAGACAKTFRLNADRELKEVAATVVSCQTVVTKAGAEDRHPKELGTIEVRINFQDIPEKQNIPLSIPAVFVVGFRDDRPAPHDMNLEQSRAGAEHTAKSVIREKFTLAVGMTTIDDINKSRDWFYRHCEKMIDEGLKPYGLYLVNITVNDITDSVGYIDAMRQKALEEFRQHHESQ